MSNVQVKISNVDVTQVLIQTWSSEPVKSLNPGESVWFAVTEGSDITVQADTDTSKMVVSLGYAEPGSPVSISMSSITLDLYSSPVYVQATTSLALKLQVVTSSASPGGKAAKGEGVYTSYQGVKCGEVIIYPPA